MKNKFQIIGMIIVNLLIGSFLGSNFTNSRDKEIQTHTQIHSDLESLNTILDTLEYIEENITNNSVLKSKLENSMVANFITISKTKPELINFKDGGRHILCRAMRYKVLHNDTFGKNSRKSYTKLAIEYLESIEIELKPYCSHFYGSEYLSN